MPPDPTGHRGAPPDAPDAPDAPAAPDQPAAPDPRRGVFETLLVRGGRAQALNAHLARLERSIQDLYGLPLPQPQRADVVDALTKLEPWRGDERARIDATPGDGRIGLRLTITATPGGAPVTLAPLTVPGGLGAHKWRDRRLVETAAAAAGGAVPLIVDADGGVLEAAWANVWLLNGDAVVTPPADGRLLPGVTRARLLALAPELGLQAIERRITLTDARASAGLFLTSSLRLAVPATLDRDEPPAATVITAAEAIRAALRDGD